tara:strand:+ start:1754 stop:2632 length:879 start_codon:yes stop_codon:yes gene_type:complete
MGLITQTGQQYYSTASPTPFGDYQFTSLDNIISYFVFAYVGEDKLINKINRTDIQFHAMRALQELSFDTFKSTKDQEIEIPPSLKMILPQDYVNYVKLTWSDKGGVEHVILPMRVSSNPLDVTQDANGDYTFTAGDLDTDNASTTNANFTEITTSNDEVNTYNSEYYWPHPGGRRGMDPEFASTNGNFFIDHNTGLIHFSSNLAGKTVILKYISDSLGTDAEMQVHKLAEEAMYKWIAYGIMSTRANVDQNIVARLKKERFAETRKAKLRLSNIKLEEITQVLRGKSKFIKH